MILYLTLILKYWQYIVIVLCSIVIVALLIRCNILDERNTALKKEHELKHKLGLCEPCMGQR